VNEWPAEGRSLLRLMAAATIGWELLGAFVVGPDLLDRCLPGCWEPLAFYALPVVLFPVVLGWHFARRGGRTRVVRGAFSGAAATGGVASVTLAVALFADLDGRLEYWIRVMVSAGIVLWVLFPLALLGIHVSGWITAAFISHHRARL
jgi:hypothetical protein